MAEAVGFMLTAIGCFHYKKYAAPLSRRFLGGNSSVIRGERGENPIFPAARQIRAPGWLFRCYLNDCTLLVIIKEKVEMLHVEPEKREGHGRLWLRKGCVPCVQ